MTKRNISVLAAILAIVAFYFGTQFATSRLIGIDGHFHIRYSQLLTERGLTHQLPEFRFTIWNDKYRDYHFLFHLLLVPFSLLPNIKLGAKIAAATFAACSGLVFLWALIQLRARTSWLWLLLLMTGSAGFLLREQMPRVQSLAMTLLVLTTVALVKRRHRLLFIAGFANVWLYDSFILLAIVGVVSVFSNRVTSEKWGLRPFRSLMMGLAAGTLINPFFPQNFESYAFNFQRVLAPFGSIPIATEWTPYTTWVVITENAPIAAVAVALLLCALFFNRTGDAVVEENTQGEAMTERIFYLSIAVVFALLFSHSRRFIEYAPPLVILFLAVVHRDLWHYLPGERRRAFATIATAAAIAGGSVNVAGFIKSNQTDDRYRCYLHAGEWIRRNVPVGETVFPADWDDTPMLYMQAPKVRYVVGLDPLFMKLHDEKLYDLYGAITMGRHKGPYAPLISKEFDSRYVFADMEEGDFLRQFDLEPGVYRVFSEPSCRIYKIIPSESHSR